MKWFAAASVLGLFGVIAAAALLPAPPHPAKTAALARPAAPGVTFARDVAPILYQNCVSCHRAGQVGPFPLVGYADAQKRARQIAMVTQSRFMPPWHADSHGEFADERRLTDAQRTTLQAWANEGAPLGDPKAVPPAPAFPSEWSLGPPDALLEPDRPYHLAADGPDVYRCFVLPTHFGTDRYVSAIEVRPGNTHVVHHVIAFLDTRGAARALAAQDAEPGYTSHGGIGIIPSGALGGWAPGNMPRRTPPGVGTLLPRDADIVLQVHYHKSGKPEVDRTRIALYFCKGPVDKRVRVLPVVDPLLYIPPGDRDYVARAGASVPADVSILQVMPHMHLLGRTMTVTAALPDGTSKPLVRVPNWDFNWQTTYTYKRPLALPKGSRISLEAHYDNSEDNPRNPNTPPRLVRWGEETTDEMCIAFVFYTVDGEHLTQGVAAGGIGDLAGGDPAQLRQTMLHLFDTDGDGTLDDKERAAMLRFFLEQMASRGTH